MEKIGILKAMMLCWKYKKMSEIEKAGIRRERFHKVVSCTRQESIFEVRE